MSAPLSPRPLGKHSYETWPQLLQEDLLNRAETTGDVMYRLRSTITTTSNFSPRRGAGALARTLGSRISARAVSPPAAMPGTRDEHSPRDRAVSRGWRKLKTPPLPDMRKEMQRKELVALVNVLINGQGIITQESLELLRDASMREAFIAELAESRHKKLSDAAFESLVQLVSHCLVEAHRTVDYRTAQLLLDTIFAFHRLTPTHEAEYLHTRVRKEDIWHLPAFWEASFFGMRLL